MQVSNCCSAPIIQDASGPDVCKDCREHCAPVEEICEKCGHKYNPQFEGTRYECGKHQQRLPSHAVPYEYSEQFFRDAYYPKEV